MDTKNGIIAVILTTIVFIICSFVCVSDKFSTLQAKDSLKKPSSIPKW